MCVCVCVHVSQEGKKHVMDETQFVHTNPVDIPTEPIYSLLYLSVEAQHKIHSVDLEWIALTICQTGMKVG